MGNKIKVEIWSDVVCPFCYIGKRKFERALDRFEHKDQVEIVWKSFQLNPHQEYIPDQNVYEYLAEVKGQSVEWSRKMHASVVQTAAGVGLEYNFDRAKVTNSLDAHRVIQLAKKHQLGGAMEERLFRAYFTEGALISDHGTLVKLASEIGLDEQEVRSALEQKQYTEEVQRDIHESRQIGVRGVPFFVLDRRLAVSGAQDPEVFLQALERAHTLSTSENPA
ncbi:DsbA family oxidoreductase [Flavilitoribacter nigricans]|uniref:Disulfide bond formation protein DsbA n=1 Tax=Flavilitoribacter nigricans (strain ATCC 23147 / DSM 23189 / NBRC 102662 / NCIMB 1420 / SS-2) TaxID=1122177 RepID=A0A2D0MZI2_FLAN2|nr:DsbA family oxidoreductase [Flavilitoribacter nigricans]PHN00853.1 disulfide bond formation protein DsbA [Flavilitoribacter nigricans DSM 23189 = NBRC 102662]